MGAQHTPGPWLVNTAGERVEIRGLPETGELIARTIERHDDVGGRAVEIANAERIVACVNACEGIVDPTKLRAVMDEADEHAEIAKDITFAAICETEELRQQRDELLATLHTIYANAAESPEWIRGCIDRAKVAAGL